MKFTIHEKQVKAKLGAEYDLSKYTEGVDYKRQKTGFGSRVMFKTGLFDLSDDLNEPNRKSSDLNANHIVLSVVDPAIVEHKQALEPIIVPVAAVKTEDEPIITRPALLDGAVRAAKVLKKHQNQRYVETDTLGTVFVGGKSQQVKLNQVISVKDGCLYLG
jgi:hypothetical protein